MRGGVKGTLFCPERKPFMSLLAKSQWGKRAKLSKRDSSLGCIVHFLILLKIYNMSDVPYCMFREKEKAFLCNMLTYITLKRPAV